MPSTQNFKFYLALDPEYLGHVLFYHEDGPDKQIMVGMFKVGKEFLLRLVQFYKDIHLALFSSYYILLLTETKSNDTFNYTVENLTFYT